MMENNIRDRLYALDNLRVFAFLMLIFYHTAIIFTAEGWHISGQYNSLLTVFSDFMSMWRLDILFAVSGAAFLFSLTRKGFYDYIKELIKKTTPALIFGVFILVPPVFIFENDFEISLIESYKIFAYEFLDKKFRWLHFWYLGYILIISIVSAFALNSSRNLFFNFISIQKRSYLSVLLITATPLILIEFYIRPLFPVKRDIVHDIASLLSFTLIFLYGAVIFTDSVMIKKIKDNIFVNLIIVLILWAILINTNISEIHIITRELLSWVIIITIAGIFFKFLNIKFNLIQNLNKNLLTFYSIHQLCILATGSFIITKIVINPIVQFFIITVFATILALVFITIFNKIKTTLT